MANAAAALAIFLSFLVVQAAVAAADPLPSLGMPSHVTLEYDEGQDRVTLTWQPPEGADPAAAYVYEVRRDGVVVQQGPQLVYVDEAPGDSAGYSIRAFDGDGWGAPAVAAFALGAGVDQWPHCLNILLLSWPFINWGCILPLPP